MAKLTQKQLKKALHYNPKTGVFSWVKPAQGRRKGRVAGAIHQKSGYALIMLHYKLHRAHRLAWLYMTGKWPKDCIDHINGVKDDNRFVNLREATVAQNAHNRKKSKNTTSKYIGVTFMKPAMRRGRLYTYPKPWFARICVNGHSMFLGSHKTEKAAYRAVVAAKMRHHSHNTLRLSV